jgi:hypothetical protein
VVVTAAWEMAGNVAAADVVGIDGDVVFVARLAGTVCRVVTGRVGIGGGSGGDVAEVVSGSVFGRVVDVV